MEVGPGGEVAVWNWPCQPCDYGPGEGLMWGIVWGTTARWGADTKKGNRISAIPLVFFGSGARI